MSNFVGLNCSGKEWLVNQPATVVLGLWRPGHEIIVSGQFCCMQERY
jgi:hypothetical protein